MSSQRGEVVDAPMSDRQAFVLQNILFCDFSVGKAACRAVVSLSVVLRRHNLYDVIAPQQYLINGDMNLDIMKGSKKSAPVGSTLRPKILSFAERLVPTILY